MNKFDINEFNKMCEQGDLLALSYIEEFTSYINGLKEGLNYAE